MEEATWKGGFFYRKRNK